MTSFVTNDPNRQCLDFESALDVYHDAKAPSDDTVVASTAIEDCANAAFIFELAAPIAAPAVA